jgi:hypothetical protein
MEQASNPQAKSRREEDVHAPEFCTDAKEDI